MNTPRTEEALIDNADLSDEGYGKSEMVRADFARKIERENIALRENCETHEKYAHMMQEQRSQLAAYCRTLEKQIEALNPPNVKAQP